uniref:TGFbeta family member nodal n=2 Tax=Lottia gigantea TaxID=225164 RepID=B6RSZ9_LOTGI|nr:TGFbeta family member nodal [Lottia gigantea]
MNVYYVFSCIWMLIGEVLTRNINLQGWPTIPDKSNFIAPDNQKLLASEEEILELFYSSGRSVVDYQKASTVFMVKLFNDLQQGKSVAKSSGKSWEKVDIAQSDTIRSFSSKAEILEARKPHKHLYFSIPHLPKNERLRSAEIRFIRHPVKSKAGVKLRFQVEVKRGDSVLKKLIIRDITKAEDEYEIIDVSRIVSPWINGYHGNISIHIKVPKKLKLSRKQGPKSLIVFYLEDGEFLSNVYKSYTDEIQTEQVKPDTVRSRQKRHRQSRNRRKWNRGGKRNSGCQLHDFEVDFNSIGWGQWIIHPKKFNARFCYGECASPIDVKYKPTNHAMLQTLMRSKRKNSAPPACCVPTKLNPLSMLYYEFDEIVVRHHEEMIASECGCR